VSELWLNETPQGHSVVLCAIGRQAHGHPGMGRTSHRLPSVITCQNLNQLDIYELGRHKLIDIDSHARGNMESDKQSSSLPISIVQFITIPGETILPSRPNYQCVKKTCIIMPGGWNCIHETNGANINVRSWPRGLGLLMASNVAHHRPPSVSRRRDLSATLEMTAVCCGHQEDIAASVPMAMVKEPQVLRYRWALLSGFAPGCQVSAPQAAIGTTPCRSLPMLPRCGRWVRDSQAKMDAGFGDRGE